MNIKGFLTYAIGIPVLLGGAYFSSGKYHHAGKTEKEVRQTTLPASGLEKKTGDAGVALFLTASAAAITALILGYEDRMQKKTRN